MKCFGDSGGLEGVGFKGSFRIPFKGFYIF